MGNGPGNHGQEEIAQHVTSGKMTPLEALTLIRNNLDNPSNLSVYIKKETSSKDTSKAVKKSDAKDKVMEKENTLEDVRAELSSLIGLKSVKELINEVEAYVKIQKRRKIEELASGPVVLHMIFKGAPGTGKTTVARIFGKLFYAMGVLEKGHLIEVERADLVGEYIGHTAQKTRRQLEKALGGILFIDEAYSLCRGGEKDFGKEAIDTLVKAMEDYKDRLVLILAGYRKEMDWFLRSNPGLRSRFPIHIDFPDYSADELLQIGDLMLKERDYKLSSEARVKLALIVKKYISQPSENIGNARFMRNLIEKAIRAQAVRLVKNAGITREELMTIHEGDIKEVDWGDEEVFNPWEK